jgi:hypothetical protein
MRRRDPLTEVVGLLCAATLLGLLPGVPAALRAAVAVAFFLVAPGLAWFRSLPVDEPVEQAAVVVALSLTVDVLVTLGLLYAGLTDLLTVLAALLLVVGAGLAVTGSARQEAAT